MTEKQKFCQDTPEPLSETDQSEKDKKDMENFVNALYANAVKNMESLG